MLDRQPRTATVRTLVPTRLIRIDRNHVEELLLRSDPVIQFLLRQLLVRFRNANGVAVEQDADSERTLIDGKMMFRSATCTRPHCARSPWRRICPTPLRRTSLNWFYQPLIALKDLSLIGYESLIRWRHPSMGLVSPWERIPPGGKTGLIHRIGQWVLQRSAADWSELRAHCRHDGATTLYECHQFVRARVERGGYCGRY
ncbi:MAG: EAL domain-containing protein [Rhodoferax sp.]|nr:EAL domain-containing protein [Rhodoferax sp.]